MDVVDVRIFSFLHDNVQCVLECADFQLVGRIGYNDGSALLAGNVRNCELTFFCLISVFCQVRTAVLLLQQFNGLVYQIHAGLTLLCEDHTVNRLEYDALIVDILDLAQGVASRMVLRFFRSQGLLQVLPHGLCGCQGVVSVAHCLENHVAFAILLNGFVEEYGQGILCAFQILLCDEGTGDVSALQHQVGIIYRSLRCVHQRLDNALVRIVDQNQDVRHLNRCTFTDAQTRWDSFDYSAFGCTGQGSGSLAEVIRFQIRSDYQTGTGTSLSGSLDEHAARFQSAESTVCQILIHGLADVCGLLRLRFFSQENFRKHQAKSGWCIPNDFLYLFPIFRFRSVLVTSNYCPLAVVGAFLWKHDFRNMESECSPIIFSHN